MERRRWAALVGVAICLMAAACDTAPFAPPQPQFAPLDTLLDDPKESVVRLYLTPTGGFELIAVHPWFVVRRAGEPSPSRWEVWPYAEAPYGHVRVNLKAPEQGNHGAGNVHIWAELTGDAAEAVGAFIENESPNYECRDSYAYFPGPNSNTYAQWVLDQTGWEVVLPPTAIGKDDVTVCR